jgi:hypothetical protein
VLFTFWTSSIGENGGQVLQWCEAQGPVVRQDTVVGEYAVFACTDSNRARLVTAPANTTGPVPTQSLIVHTRYDDGRQDPPDTVFTERMTSALALSYHAFTMNEGEIAGAPVILRDTNADGLYDMYQVRLVRYGREGAFVGEWQDVMAVQPLVNMTQHTLVALPDRAYLFGYFNWITENSEIRFAVLDSTGNYTPVARRIRLTADQYLTGFDLLVDRETVYYTFCTEHDVSSPDSLFNVIVGGFPVSMLDEDGVADPAPVVQSADLSIYPNPFNGAARLQFDLPRELMLALDVFDLQGRHVQTLVRQAYPAGRHTVNWSADGWPSGMYFVRMTTPQQQRLHKALLVR